MTTTNAAGTNPTAPTLPVKSTTSIIPPAAAANLAEQRREEAAEKAAAAVVIRNKADHEDQRFLDQRIVAIEDGIEAVLDIARNWTDLRNLSRLHPGVSAQEYILSRVKHHLGLEAQNHAGSIAVEAAIRQGEILAQMAEQGQRQRPGMADGSRSEPSVPTLADLNTTKRESADAQALANQAEAVREWVAGAKEITPRKAASVARKAKRENDPPPPPTIGTRTALDLNTVES